MDQRRFLSFFLEHQGLLKAYVLVATHNPSDADDLLQEVAGVLWEKFEQYDAGRPFRAWALGVARMEVLKWRQRRARSREVLSEEALEAMADTADELAEEAAARRSHLRTCLEKLAERASAVMRMRYRDSHAIAAIAERMKQSVASVEMILVRARRALRECIDRRMVRESRS